MELLLPNELIGLTFHHLDVPSLLRCMQVCKLFYSIISGNTQLMYKAELFASYMEDNEHASMDVVTRLSVLRKYNQLWNDMEWTSSGSIPMRDGRCWEFSGGIFAQATFGDEIFFVQLPCKLKNIPERRWTVPFGFVIRDFTLDSSQDLVVLLELASNMSNTSCRVNVHLRTLTGEPHPRSAMSQLTHTLENMGFGFSFLIQICGDHVAILFYDQLGELSQNTFIVSNWRTGERKVVSGLHLVCSLSLTLREKHISMPKLQSFAFMTEDLILAGVLKSHSNPVLRVLSVAAFNNQVYSLEDMPYICELQYPELRSSTEYFLIRSEPTPTWRPPAGLDVPFYCSRKDFIFTISMHCFLNEMHQSIVLIVPLSTLLSEVERSRDSPRRHVAWNEWGPSGARIVFREPSETWVCYTYGMKFIQGLRCRHRARVYDFNPYAPRKYAKPSGDSPIPWRRLLDVSKTSSRCEIFGEEVTTALPGRAVSITLEQSAVGWDAVMIGEDHILMVQTSTSTYGYMSN